MEILLEPEKLDFADRSIGAIKENNRNIPFPIKFYLIPNSSRHGVIQTDNWMTDEDYFWNVIQLQKKKLL